MKLNETLTRQMCSNNCGSYFIQRTPEAIIKHYQELFFDDLLKAQPGLKDDIDAFIYGAKNTDLTKFNPIDVFTQLLKDKVEVKSVTKQLTNFGYSCRLNTNEKTAFINSVYDLDRGFLKDLHNQLKETGSKYTTPESALLSYITIVKKDKGVTKLDREEVLGIASNIKAYKMDQLKKLTNFYTYYIGKTEECADKIYELVKNSIATDGTIKKLWEDKISTFPKEIQDKYLEHTENKFKPYQTKTSYFSSYSLDPNWLIDEFNYSVTKANSTTSNLYIVIEDTLRTAMKNQQLENTYDTHIRNGAVIEVHSKSEEVRSKVDKIVEVIFEALPADLSKMKEVDYSNRQGIIDRLVRTIDSYFLAEGLENDLTTKVAPKKGMKI